jgi:pSer/pThr/pTyr-binding forkhead associated (FHA) protein
VGKSPAEPRKATDGWQLRLDDGRTLPVRGLVLIGRSPQPQPDEQAELVQAGVESRMVSKTHLAIGLDHRGLYVMDRGSTNGTAIANSGGQFEPCAAGDPVRVREGQVVSFGDRYLEVRREPQ